MVAKFQRFFKQHMLKLSEPDLRQLVFEYGLENSQISQHITNSKLQFHYFSQNQETIISAMTLEKQNKTFCVCA